MSYGSMSNDNGEFTFSDDRYRASISANPENKSIFKVAVGGAEFIRGLCEGIYISMRQPHYQVLRKKSFRAYLIACANIAQQAIEKQLES